jgi:hypothetical protein
VKRLISSPRAALWLLLASLTLALAGCTTTESENASSRPWNAPQAWETGALPGSFNQSR